MFALQSQLDDALNAKPPNIAVLALLVQDFEIVSKDKNPRLWLSCQLSEAILSVSKAEFDRCEQIARTAIDSFPGEKFPVLRFRLQSVRAAALLAGGKVAPSLELFQSILADPDSRVPAFYLLRARINYAAALNANGELHSAANEYERVMMEAIEKGEDATARHCGNNLVAILKDQDELDAAQRVLDLLAPQLNQETETASIGLMSLRLHALDLKRLQGEYEASSIELRKLLSQENLPAIIKGSAHRQLALCLLNMGQLQQAEENARESVEVFSDRKLDLFKAQLAFVKVLLAREKSNEALSVLAEIATPQKANEIRNFHSLNLRARLMKDELFEELERLNQLEEATDSYVQESARTRREYLDARVSALEEARRVREAEARTLTERKARESQQRHQMQLLGLVAIGTVIVCFAMYFALSHRTTTLLLAKEKEQTETLTTMVEEKTRELRDSLSAKAEMAMRLERKRRLESIGALAGNVAHDINNLFQVVSSSNDLLEQKIGNQPELQEVLQVSNQSLDHGAAMLDKLLSYSGRQVISKRRIDYGKYMEQTLPLIQSMVRGHAEVFADDEYPDCVLNTDETQLTTTILNIVKNSMEAMSDGGMIQLHSSHCSLSEEDARTESVQMAGDYLKLRISDTGCGMEPEQVERAFEPFYSSKEKNSGLGLSSSYGFIKQSGGNIRVTRTDSEGTEIEILLPACSQPPSSKTKLDGMATELEGLNTLLVEDNASVAKSLVSLLSHLKMNVTRVQSGAEALEILRQRSFSLVLSDVRMPGSPDGEELATWVAEHFPKKPFLLMTGYRHRATHAVPAPIIAKPFGVEKLVSALNDSFPELFSGNKGNSAS